MDVIVYYRIRPSDPSYSGQALEEQRAAVQSWLASHPDTIKAEYIEPETDGFSRPHLREAIEACKQTGATLLIARTEAVGSGEPFSPRIISVPTAFAPKTPRDKGYIIPAPEKAPAGLTLYFPDRGSWHIIPVYLCNRTDQVMRDIKASTVGITTHVSMSTPTGSAPFSTTPTSLTIEQLASNTAVLIDRYDPMIDGDFITSYDVAYIDPKAQRQRRCCLIGSDGPSVMFLETFALETKR
jgi:hypothetical protein